MKKAIFAGSIAGALILGAHSNANASDQLSTNQLIDRVTAAEQYQAKVNENIKWIVDLVTPSGIEYRRFGNYATIPNGSQEGAKSGTVSRGLYIPLMRKNSEKTESILHFWIWERREKVQWLGISFENKTVEAQLVFSIRH